MTPLCELAAKYGTDKLKHGYTPFYHGLFAPLRDRPITLMELGVYQGASIRMWLEYFPNAKIIGVDKSLRAISGISATKAEGILQDVSALVPVKEYGFPAGIDILIDDASHKPADQIVAFETLWPRITVGGYYVVEDLHAGWAWDEHGEHALIVSLKNAISNDIRHKTHFLGQYADVHFYRNLVAIRKN